jgi:hypothetical protein
MVWLMAEMFPLKSVLFTVFTARPTTCVTEPSSHVDKAKQQLLLSQNNSILQHRST